MTILLALWVATFLLAVMLALFVVNIAWALLAFVAMCLVGLVIAAYW
jgi:hypothetical protein